MPENEFDKKVSSELQQLRFKPSDAVWMKVEERIQKKKKRRVFIIIFLLAGIALLGYWQWDNFFGENNEKIVEKETSIGEKNNSVNNTDQNSKETNTINENTQKVDKESRNEELPRTDVSIDKNNNNVSLQPIEEKKKDILAIEGQKKNAKRTRNANNPIQNKAVVLTEADLTTQTKDESQIVKDTSGIIDPDNDRIKPDTIQNIKLVDNPTDPMRPDTLVKKIDLRKDSVAKKVDTVLKVVPVDSPVVNIPKNPSRKKWKWGAQFVPGISALNENGFSFNMNKSDNALYYQSPSPGSGGVVSRQKPSDVKPGFAFQLGTFLQRQLSQKTDISLGLQYGFYSTRIGIGTSRDSLLRFANLQDANSVYNAGGDTIHYTNRYHFIELPVRFQWQLNKNKTWPISWNAGASVSYLFATNALMYDTAFNGIYYQNNKLLNRTQVSLSTGFSFTIVNNRKMQWALGPFIDFHLNKLVDNPFERNKYLLFTGVRTSVIFNR